jgi:hypothetical protein
MRFESARSGEVAATPRPPVIAAEIRHTPATRAECCWAGVLERRSRADAVLPERLYATIELLDGYRRRSSIARRAPRTGGARFRLLEDRRRRRRRIAELERRARELPPLLVPERTRSPSAAR